MWFFAVYAADKNSTDGKTLFARSRLCQYYRSIYGTNYDLFGLQYGAADRKYVQFSFIFFTWNVCVTKKSSSSDSRHGAKFWAWAETRVSHQRSRTVGGSCAFIRVAWLSRFLDRYYYYRTSSIRCTNEKEEDSGFDVHFFFRDLLNHHHRRAVRCIHENSSQISTQKKEVLTAVWTRWQETISSDEAWPFNILPWGEKFMSMS